MTRRELDAAGIRDPWLRSAYEWCRALNAEHGRTYFLATRLLSPGQRPAVHALYGFARWVDDLVDEPGACQGGRPRDDQLGELQATVRTALDTGRSQHPILAALVDTATRYHLDPALFTEFMRSMRMDLTISEYATRAELDSYVHGSAGVIGLQVLPVLGTSVDQREATEYATALGAAFQLTNFLRDIGEDLDRGRVYLPAEELAAFGVDRERLLRCRRSGRPDPPVRRALSDQVARTQAVYRQAEPGIAMLDPVSRPCVATAFTLYREILDEVVRSGYDVFRRRLVVPASRRLAVAMPTLGAAVTVRSRRRLARQ